MSTIHALPASATMQFPPILSASQMSSIVWENAKAVHARTREACESALLAHIHETVPSETIYRKLVEVVNHPYGDHVSVDLFVFGNKSRIKVEGCDRDMSIALLLFTNGNVHKSLNMGLGADFRVVRERREGAIAMCMEFWPQGFPKKPVRGIMNPEDEEDFIALPMRPRNTSVESE
jgi:hypothetical protein